MVIPINNILSQILQYWLQYGSVCSTCFLKPRLFGRWLKFQGVAYNNQGPVLGEATRLVASIAMFLHISYPWNPSCSG